MTVRAFSAGWVTSIARLLRRGGGIRPGRLSMTCLLVERADGLVLVDTGFAVAARNEPRKNVGTLFQLFSPISLPVGDAAAERVRAIGKRPEDVTDVILTHLDVDHAAGLVDFPEARVHVARSELQDALESWNPRYRQACWAHGPRWERHDLVRQETLGFPTSRDVFGDGSVVLLGAAGHSKGHVAVALRNGAKHVVHTGDAVYLEDEATLGLDGLGPGLRAMRRLVDRDRDEAERTRRLVASLMKDPRAVVVTAHDERGLARLAPFPYPIG